MNIIFGEERDDRLLRVRGRTLYDPENAMLQVAITNTHSAITVKYATETYNAIGFIYLECTWGAQSFVLVAYSVYSICTPGRWPA